MQTDDVCQAVYEPTTDNGTGHRLVLTTWMLLDELKQCQEEMEAALAHIYETGVGQERRYGVPYNPLANRIEKAHFNVSHILRLLWRSGLWTEDGITEATDIEGKSYNVLAEPFTDGKAHGRPLQADCPRWRRELLGLPVISDSGELTYGMPDSFRFRERRPTSLKKAA